MTRRVLFLDIDGVLNSFRTVTLHEGVIANTSSCKKKMLLPHNDNDDIALFDRLAVDFVFNFCRKYDYRIVMSTSWRYSFSLNDFIVMFSEHYGVVDAETLIVGATPKGRSDLKTRGDEIAEWLALNPEVVEYIILDDSSDFLDEQKPFFVQTCIRDGLTFRNMNRMIALTGNKPLLDFYE